MDQLNGFLLGFLIVIKILATVCSQPLSQLLGANFCYLFELSGTLYLSGSVVWTSFIAFFRVWYIKVWVRNQYLPPSNYYISVANLLDYVRNHSISYEHITCCLEGQTSRKLFFFNLKWLNWFLMKVLILCIFELVTQFKIPSLTASNINTKVSQSFAVSYYVVCY